MSTWSMRSELVSKGWGLQAVHDLEELPSPGCWLAVGDDPQFLLSPPDAIPAGWCLVKMVLRAVSGPVRNPVLYIDYGSGFEEHDRVVLAAGEIDGQVNTLMRLDRPVVRFRFDPSDRAGEFDLIDLNIRALTPTQAVWECLRIEKQQWGEIAPVSFAAFVERARELVESKGEEYLVAWIQSIREDAIHPTRYFRWINNAERVSSGPIDGAGSLCVVLLPRVDIEDARAAYASVAEQLGPHDEFLIPTSLATHLPDPLRVGTRLVEENGMEFWGVGDATADFITWLGPGERLHPSALDVIGRALKARPSVRIAYTDEDFIDANNERCRPYFKSAWDRELLVAQDYPARSVVIERELAIDYASRISGAAWLYAASLEATEALGEGERLHIPAVTRHHRHPFGGLHAPLHADSEALMLPMRRALGDWLARWYPHVETSIVTDHRLSRLNWPLPANQRVDIIIPTRDRVDLLSKCVDSILRLTDSVDYSIIILDNGSAEAATLEYLEQIVCDARVRVLRHDVPFNYSAINNHAVANGDGDIVVLLNNDVEIIDGRWLYELTSLAARPRIGVVGAKLLYPDGTIQHAGVLLGVGAVLGGVAAHAHAHLPSTTPGYFGRALVTQSMSAVTAACLAIKREIFEEVGGLDPILAVAFNDVDFCLRVREAGYINLWTPDAVLLHHESATRGFEDSPEKQARFAGEVQIMIDRWSHAFDSDPAYSPNLALAPKEFTIDPQRYARS